MKSLVAGIVLIILIGIGGFIYRNVQERTGGPVAVVCTEEAKVCPDGSSVGRSGPACEFAPCPSMRAEFTDAGLTFDIPEGYSAVALASDTEPSVLASYTKPSSQGNPPNIITMLRYPVPAGDAKKADERILSFTRFQPADMQAEDFSRFDTKLINGYTLRSTVIERFEGVVHSNYYLVHGNDLFIFQVYERNVADWTNPKLVVEQLPEHKALLEMLSTLELK